MTATATDTISALSALTGPQAAAVEVLASGGSHREAAEVAGVARETVSRWLSHSPAFRAALGRLRYASAEAVTDRTIRVRGLALEVLERHLASVDPDSPAGLAAAVSALRVVPPVSVVAPDPAEVIAVRLVDGIRPAVASEGSVRLLAAMDDPRRDAERVASEAAGLSD